MNRISIGQRICKLRGEKGFSTADLAERIGKSQATVSRIENGKQGASIELLGAIAQALQVHPFVLMSATPPSHSRLLPMPAPVWPPEKMARRYLGRILFRARAKTKLSLEEAARRLDITTEELESIEVGIAVPDRVTLERMGVLYPVDARELTGIAFLEEKHPNISERMVLMETLIESFRNFLRDHPAGNADDPRWKGFLGEMDRCLGEESGDAGVDEREGEYFSIGHLSNTLLRALQDRDFHDRVENMAGEFLENRTPRPDDDASPASDSPPETSPPDAG